MGRESKVRGGRSAGRSIDCAASGPLAGPGFTRTHTTMQNWIGIGIWIVLGVLIALGMKALIKRPEETEGHTVVLAALGAFGALIGGMLGVGLGEFFDPRALSLGGTVGAVVFATFISWLYRWGIRTLI